LAAAVTRRRHERAGGHPCFAGSSTWSITWITPFDCFTSSMVTAATPPFSSFTTTFVPCIIAISLSPFTVVSVAVPLPALMAFTIAAASMFPATTWYVSMPVRAAFTAATSVV